MACAPIGLEAKLRIPGAKSKKKKKIIFGFSRVKWYFIILELLVVGYIWGPGFILLINKSSLAYGFWCVSFGKFQLGICLLVKEFQAY